MAEANLRNGKKLFLMGMTLFDSWLICNEYLPISIYVGMSTYQWLARETFYQITRIHWGIYPIQGNIFCSKSVDITKHITTLARLNLFSSASLWCKTLVWAYYLFLSSLLHCVTFGDDFCMLSYSMWRLHSWIKKKSSTW